AIDAASRTVAPQGRLFIVDFETHDHEFLRAEHNHARLGFARDEMEQWARAAGLDTLEYRSLKPSDKANDPGAGLVVGIWVFAPRRGGNPWL
ncbi:MAG: ArsR family transcriptional regulator, partial [Pseudomonadota bacterium]